MGEAEPVVQAWRLTLELQQLKRTEPNLWGRQNHLPQSLLRKQGFRADTL